MSPQITVDDFPANNATADQVRRFLFRILRDSGSTTYHAFQISNKWKHGTGLDLISCSPVLYRHIFDRDGDQVYWAYMRALANMTEDCQRKMEEEGAKLKKLGADLVYKCIGLRFTTDSAQCAYMSFPAILYAIGGDPIKSMYKWYFFALLMAFIAWITGFYATIVLYRAQRAHRKTLE